MHFLGPTENFIPQRQIPLHHALSRFHHQIPHERDSTNNANHGQEGKRKQTQKIFCHNVCTSTLQVGNQLSVNNSIAIMKSCNQICHKSPTTHNINPGRGVKEKTKIFVVIFGSACCKTWINWTHQCTIDMVRNPTIRCRPYSKVPDRQSHSKEEKA